MQFIVFIKRVWFRSLGFSLPRFIYIYIDINSKLIPNSANAPNSGQAHAGTPSPLYELYEQGHAEPLVARVLALKLRKFTLIAQIISGTPIDDLYDLLLSGETDFWSVKSTWHVPALKSPTDDLYDLWLQGETYP